MLERPQYEPERHTTKGQQLAGVMLIVPALVVSMLGLGLVATGAVGVAQVLLVSDVDPLQSKGIYGRIPTSILLGAAGLAVIALSSAMMMMGQIISGRKRRVKPDQLPWLVGYIAMRDTTAVLWFVMLVVTLVCLLGQYWLGSLCVILVLGVAWASMVACNRKMAEIEKVDPPGRLSARG
ncbi:hypothetical protein [Oceaniferula spumae]